MDPLGCGNQHVSGFENSLDYGIVPLTRSSLFADAAISQCIQDSDRMFPSTAFHRRGIALASRTLISLIAIGDLALVGEVYLAVMDRRSGRFKFSDETKVIIYLAMEFVAKIGFIALLRPRSVGASPRLRLLAAWRVRLRMPRIRGDKSRVLNGCFNLMRQIWAHASSLRTPRRPYRIDSSGSIRR